MSKYHSTISSFSFAISGLKSAIKDEPNIRIHLVLASIAIVLAIILGFSFSDWVILIFTIAFVLILELVNTAIEEIVDLISPEFKDQAKRAKDVSAAAVLVSSLLSVIIACFLYLPKIISLL